MTRHLVRLMWNRKRQNLLLMVEIFVAFLIVVIVSVMGVHFGYNAMQPLGFSAADVWALEVRRSGTPGVHGGPTEGDREVFRQIEAELSSRPQIQAASGAFTGPYRWFSWSDDLNLEGREPLLVSVNRTDDNFSTVLGLSLVDGRWFSRDDDASVAGGWEPIVINRRLALDVFGTESVAGRTIVEVPRNGPGPDQAGRRSRPKRVVGVIDDFRQFGELSTPTGVMFYRRTLDAPLEQLELPDVLMLKLQPGTTAAFEEALLRRLRAMAPTWSFGVEPVEASRESMLREHMAPLLIVAIVAAAMLLMVALGLTGVVWQSVTQRMREFGLRRAQGATGTGVGGQVITELVVMTSFAIGAGCLLLLQVPLLPLPREIQVIPAQVFVAGVAVAIVAVYSVTILCAWYPSRLATRVPPAEALRYE
ncbi:MAG: ABC transporter permease [Acidobacteria bacterium]|nr:ABC transporter permease [Acidobacteriota bacterium]